MNRQMQSRLVVGFSLQGGPSTPATPLDQRTYPSWAALVPKNVAYQAVEKRRSNQAKAMACPDKRLHPHLCNCKMPRVLIATPKTNSLKRVRAKKKRLLEKHLRGGANSTNMYERVTIAASKYTPIISAKRRPHYVKAAPSYELYIPLANPLEKAALHIQRVWQGYIGRNKYRKVYFFYSVRTTAKYFDDWKKVVKYQFNLRKIAAIRYIQRNIRAIYQWRLNRDTFLTRARQMTTLLWLLERLLKYKILHNWHSTVVFHLHRRKFTLTWFHLQRHTALCKLFRTTRHHLLRKTLRKKLWKNVLDCQRMEKRARCTIVMSRWKKLCVAGNLIRHRRKRVTFKAWVFYWIRSKSVTEERYRNWAAGVFQREIRGFLARHNYNIKTAAIRLINRVGRGALGRKIASKRWYSQYRLTLYRSHFTAWLAVSILWKKQRVYRENVSSRLNEYGVHEKTGEWANVEEVLEKSWTGESFYSQFPPPKEELTPYPMEGKHIDEYFQPPLEWGVTKKKKTLWGRARGSAFMMLRGNIKSKGLSDDGENGESKNSQGNAKEEIVRARVTLTVVKARQTAAHAASKGFLNLLKWLRLNGCEWDEDVMAEAALGGHLDVLQWSLKNGCVADYRTTENAALMGHIHVLQFAMENDLVTNVRMAVLMAARGQQLKTLKWLAKTQTGFAVHPMCVVTAILGSQNIGEKDDENVEVVEMIEWLYENSESVKILTAETTAAAARRGRLELLQWLRRFGTPWDWRTLTAIREMKRQKVKRWVMKNGGKSIKPPGDKGIGFRPG